MRGSAKQIAWATEIQARVIRTLECCREKMQDDPKEVAMFDKLIAGVKSAEYAGDIIDLFADFELSGIDLQHDYRNLINQWRIAARDPDLTPAKKRILSR